MGCEAIADTLLAAWDAGRTLPRITEGTPDFDTAAAYEVLGHIAARRVVLGWQAVGRKIGFTNRTIWELYGVDRPIWAHVWDRTVLFGAESVSLGSLVEPRIEPEVVFKLRAPVPVGAHALEVLDCVEWMAPGFEIVQSHFAGLEVHDCGVHSRVRAARRAGGGRARDAHG